MGASNLLVNALIFVEEELEGRHGHVELVDEMLGETRELQLSVTKCYAASGLQFTTKKAEEGGLTHSVRADEGHAAVHVNAQVEVSEQDFVGGIPESSVLELEEGRGKWIWL
jgi:hypothetical protein